MEKRGLMFMHIIINRAHTKLLLHAPEHAKYRYGEGTGRKHGTRGTARVLDQCFCSAT